MNNVDVLKTPRLCFCWPSARSQSMVGKSRMSCVPQGLWYFRHRKRQTNQKDTREFCAEFSWRASDFFWLKENDFYRNKTFFFIFIFCVSFWCAWCKLYYAWILLCFNRSFSYCSFCCYCWLSTVWFCWYTSTLFPHAVYTHQLGLNKEKSNNTVSVTVKLTCIVE